MGCATSHGKELGKASKVSKEIEAEILRGRSRFHQQMTILLLGPGESGKSTFLKNIKIIYMDEYKNHSQENQLLGDSIRNNLVRNMQLLIKASLKMKLPIATSQNREYAEFLLEEGHSPFTSQEYTAIESLWKDHGIQQIFREKRSQIQIQSNADYFFKEIGRIAEKDYCPTQEDVLKMRIMTGGINETTFNYNSNQQIKIVDVGGQRCERRKWHQIFENDISSVLYFCAISEFDQVCFEDLQTNRLDEALTLFHEICFSRHFVKTPLILFLNKSDLLIEKLKYEKWEDMLPHLKDYNGQERDLNDVFLHFKRLFKDIHAQSPHGHKNFFVHLTCATDTLSVKKVFSDVQQAMLTKATDELF